MKKFVAVLAFLMLTLGVSAQSHYGVIGGLTFSNAPRVSELESYKMATLYHAGITYQYKFPLGFAIQPSVLYNVKGSNIDEGDGTYTKLREGNVEIPISLQWGPDLLLFRPYVEVVPFMGFTVFSNFADDPQLFEGGLGVGGGLEIWKVQISARYNWNFTPYTKAVPGYETPWAFRYTTLSFAFLF